MIKKQPTHYIICWEKKLEKTLEKKPLKFKIGKGKIIPIDSKDP